MVLQGPASLDQSRRCLEWVPVLTPCSTSLFRVTSVFGTEDDGVVSVGLCVTHESSMGGLVHPVLIYTGVPVSYYGSGSLGDLGIFAIPNYKAPSPDPSGLPVFERQMNDQDTSVRW